MVYPIDSVVAVTYKCQSRCRMCSIWQIKEHGDIPPEVYGKLPKTLKDVNISGGEPFLRGDLPDIVRIIHGRLPRCRIVVSSNGLLGKKLVPMARELTRIFPGIGFAFALDGIGDKHDFIRGVQGGYEKALSAINGLKANGIRNTRIAFTLTTENADHMIRVYDLARELGVQFTMQVAHDSDFFFGKNESSIVKKEHPHLENDSLCSDMEKIINSELSSFDLKRWGKAFVYYGMYKIIMEGKQLYSSRPGVDYFYLDPSGDVYPSVVHNYVMGNLAESDFEAIWASQESEEIRRKCREDTTPYWMGCMLRKALLDHRFQIGMWALKNKFLKLKL